MKVIHETLVSEHKEMLPQIIQRMFSVCKSDTNFPLKNKIETLDGKVSSLREKVMRQMQIARKAKKTREDLMVRIEDLEYRNQDIKNELLGYLGSE